MMDGNKVKTVPGSAAKHREVTSRVPWLKVYLDFILQGHNTVRHERMNTQGVDVSHSLKIIQQAEL